MAVSEAVPVAQKAAFYAVIACWWVFLLTFWLRGRPPRVRETKRDWTSLIGMLLQSIAYFCIWSYPLQRKGSPPVRFGPPLRGWGLAVLAVAIAVLSTWLVNAAARRLGKQWALAARLVEGHMLIQDGPYRFVRNPIYAGMFGMLLATGLVLSRWIPLLVAILLFAAGTWIRVHREERLLREAFGSEFEAYKRNVPALIPGIY